jgi:hypothetical protein
LPDEPGEVSKQIVDFRMCWCCSCNCNKTAEMRKRGWRNSLMCVRRLDSINRDSFAQNVVHQVVFGTHENPFTCNISYKFSLCFYLRPNTLPSNSAVNFKF